jgi:hypothetical protein
MNNTRNGKIARLPKAVREQLNQRLENGEPGTALVEWLNSLPEVQGVVAAEFGGVAVRDQNISQWKQGGYRDWLMQQETLEMAQRIFDDGAELKEVMQGAPAEKMAVWVAARYLVRAKRLEGQDPGEEEVWKRLREFCKDVVGLRRGDYHLERMKLEHEKFADGKRNLLQRGLDELAEAFKQSPAAAEVYKQSVVMLCEQLRKEGKIIPGYPEYQ